jgi:hypothetical protein
MRPRCDFLTFAFRLMMMIFVSRRPAPNLTMGLFPLLPHMTDVQDSNPRLKPASLGRWRAAAARDDHLRFFSMGAMEVKVLVQLKLTAVH